MPFSISGWPEALAALALLAGFACGEAQERRAPVLLVTLDTTRADRLSAYGYARATSPNLDALAADATLYTRAVATASWTLPSHASLFSGRFTASHGARYDEHGSLLLADAFEGPLSLRRFRARGMGADVPVLPELLRTAGYATAAVVAGPWLASAFGLARGFELYDDSGLDAKNGRPAESVTDAAIRWLEGPRDRPFFLFLNYFDPHAPYRPPTEFAERFLPAAAELATRAALRAEYSDLYDAEILYMDHHLGRLFEYLKAAGLYEDSWIIVTADHGELLGERGRFGHGLSLSEPELHVPLLVKAPGSVAAGRRSDLRIQLTDVLPLLAAGLGLPLPPGVQGQAPPGIEHPVIAEAYPPDALTRQGDWRALYEDDIKLLWNEKGSHHLYDLARDPAEAVDLAARQPERVTRMTARLNLYLDGLPRPGPEGPVRQVDTDTRRALEGLGYLD